MEGPDREEEAAEECEVLRLRAGVWVSLAHQVLGEHDTHCSQCHKPIRVLGMKGCGHYDGSRCCACLVMAFQKGPRAHWVCKVCGAEVIDMLLQWDPIQETAFPCPWCSQDVSPPSSQVIIRHIKAHVEAKPWPPVEIELRKSIKTPATASGPTTPVASGPGTPLVTFGKPALRLDAGIRVILESGVHNVPLRGNTCEICRSDIHVIGVKNCGHHDTHRCARCLLDGFQKSPHAKWICKQCEGIIKEVALLWEPEAVDIPNFPCPWCPMLLADQGDILAHLRTHVGGTLTRE